jgi:SNF2 family DNA or RNA helicase
MQELSSFVEKFIGVPSDKVKDCLNKLAAKFDKTPDTIAQLLLKEINAERAKCIKFSKEKSLFNYQKEIVESFYSQRGVIAAFATGTGKTLTAVTSAACVHNMAKLFGRECNVLVVTPASLVDNMKEEFEKFNYDFGEDLKIISSNIFRDTLLYKKRLRANSTFDSDRFMEINAKRNVSGVVCNQNTFLIIDEAHEFKTDYNFNFSEKTFHKVPEDTRAEMFVDECYPFIWKVLLLTATPMLNRWYDIANLVAAVKGVNPSFLVDKFLISDSKNLIHNISLKNVIDRSYISYGKVNVTDSNYFKGVVHFKEVDKNNKDFPKRNEEIYQMAVMDSVYYAQVQAIMSKIKTQRKKKIPEENLEKELQAIQKKLADLPNNPKIKIVKEILKTHNYDKILIYSRFVKPLKGLIENLSDVTEKEKYETFIITGQDVTPKKRQEYLKRINLSKKSLIFISDAGGMGLDFKCIEAVIIYEPGINISREEQAIGRAVRFKSHVSLPEHKKRVDIYKLIMRYPKTVEGKTPDQIICIRALEKELESQSFKLTLESINKQTPSFHQN